MRDDIIGERAATVAKLSVFPDLPVNIIDAVPNNFCDRVEIDDIDIAMSGVEFGTGDQFRLVTFTHTNSDGFKDDDRTVGLERWEIDSESGTAIIIGADGVKNAIG